MQLLLGDADAEEERELQQALWLSSQQQQPYDMDAQGLQQDDRPDQGLLCLVHYYHADNQSHGRNAFASRCGHFNLKLNKYWSSVESFSRLTKGLSGSTVLQRQVCRHADIHSRSNGWTDKQTGRPTEGQAGNHVQLQLASGYGVTGGTHASISIQ